MEDLFFMWSVKAGGWMTDAGTYTSDYKLAGKFKPNRVVPMLIAHYQPFVHEIGMIPVRITDLDCLRLFK